ncbi:MAG: menaquinone biosynthesis protein [Planctomycetaceae bacterium]|jgi:chorismate dehydratase|nr:menaquinone biosynthesis protein [Planctomycetaceae bacterium]
MPNIGTVPYCNALPLIHYLPETLPGVNLSEWFPSAMRLRLQTHLLDIALLPVAELMHLPGGRIISDCSIACNGTVRSVLLVSQKPLEQIQTLSLDTASRSSITIAQIILQHFYNLKPKLYKLDAGKPLNGCGSDAFVVIGDPALAYKPSKYWTCFDLGGLWREKTGLPLVFAAWIGCTESGKIRAETLADWRNAAAALRTARDRGLENIETILGSKTDFPCSRQEMYEYFTQNIVYTLGTEERKGLQMFFDLAALHGFTKHRTAVDFIDG